MKLSKLQILKRISVGIIVVVHVSFLNRIPASTDFYMEIIKISTSFLAFIVLNAIIFRLIDKFLSRS
jgi:hypothetical protein